MPHGPALVIGGGLAGVEAAWQLAQRGVDVELWEMRPHQSTPAHETELLAELVCSNSLRGDGATHAVGLLKEEMTRLGSLVMDVARATAVPAGRALAVDRRRFAQQITDRLEGHERITVSRQEAKELPRHRSAIVATGPLTSESLSEDIKSLTGGDQLHYYDAIAPVLDAESLDRDVIFSASRYEEGEGDYLNIPLDEGQYMELVRSLQEAEQVRPHPFEKEQFFEGCLPVEVIASRGALTLAHGPLKPVGLVDPRTDRRSFAVVQLRKEDEEATAFNIVGFQTRMTQGEQARVLRALPGLAHVEFLRYGSIHRNTYVEAPRVLGERLELLALPTVRLAGQVTGVEGYVESAACGLLAGLFHASDQLGVHIDLPPRTTALGGLLWHLSGGAGGRFTPSNITWALLPAPPRHRKKAERRKAATARALADLQPWIETIHPRIG